MEDDFIFSPDGACENCDGSRSDFSMKTRLTKEQSRQRWSELRKLWNSWDPIGVVMDGEPPDEYDNYLGPCLRLLEKDAAIEELAGYLRQVVDEYMGLGQSGIENAKPREFAVELKEWYLRHWPDTYV